MRLKKILATGMICAMTLSLTACGEEEANYDPINLEDFANSNTTLSHNFFILSAKDGKAYPTVDAGINENSDHWYLTEEQLPKIKELGKDDQLIYTNLNERPTLVQLTRFDELGYTVGTNFSVIDSSEDSSTTDEVNTNSLITANLDSRIITFGPERNQFSPISEYLKNYISGGNTDSSVETANNENIQIKKINGLEMKTSMLTSSGYLKGLTKDAMYKFGYYRGTHYGEITIKADSLLLYANGIYQTASVSEMEDTYFVINLPSNLENGYYYIEDYGLFKYTGNNQSLDDKKVINNESGSEPTNAETTQQESEASGESTQQVSGVTE